MGIGFRQQPTANENPQRGGPSMSHYEAPFYSLSLSLFYFLRTSCSVWLCVSGASSSEWCALHKLQQINPPLFTPLLPSCSYTQHVRPISDRPRFAQPSNSQIMKKGEKRLANNEEKFIFVVAGCCSINTNLQKKKKKARIDRYENSGKAFLKIADTIESGPHDRRKCIHRDKKKRMEPQSRNVALAAA